MSIHVVYATGIKLPGESMDKELHPAQDLRKNNATRESIDGAPDEKRA